MKEKQTEDKIAEAAREIFIEKGMDGARMQEIADRAGINKSLLHYYFRSKEKLFDFVFAMLLGQIGGMLTQVMKEEVSIEEKLTVIVDTYTDILLKNPFMPNFIINEITRNPDGLLVKFAASNINPQIFFEPLDKQLKSEGYTIAAQDFIIYTISVVIFPIVARPILQRIVFNNNKAEYQNYMINRKADTIKFILSGLNDFKR